MQWRIQSSRETFFPRSVSGAVSDIMGHFQFPVRPSRRHTSLEQRLSANHQVAGPSTSMIVSVTRALIGTSLRRSATSGFAGGNDPQMQALQPAMHVQAWAAIR